jgi:hypothetical protein
VILTVPFILFKIIKNNHEKLSDSIFALKYSTIYNSLNYEKANSLYYVLIFFAKRIVVAFSLVFLRKDFNIQMLFIMNSSVICCIYYIRQRPFRTNYLNRIELFNESTFLLCSYLTFLFTDVVEETSIKIQIGWFFIFVILVNLSVNFSGIFYVMFKHAVKIFAKFKKLFAHLDKLETVKL